MKNLAAKRLRICVDDGKQHPLHPNDQRIAALADSLRVLVRERQFDRIAAALIGRKCSPKTRAKMRRAAEARAA